MVCTKCYRQYDSGSARFRCESCNSVLEVKYNYSKLRMNGSFRRAKISHRKYIPFFPLEDGIVSLGEGGTKLLNRKMLSASLGGKSDLYFKIETYNPTKTFKDRGSSVEISKAKELGYRKICCASTGNMGLSLATYAKTKRIRCTVFISRDANVEKLEKIKRQGAHIEKVDGDFNESLREAERYAKEEDIFLCGDYHYRKEGQKSLIFEVIEQMHYRVPDYLFVPVGNSTLLAAIFKGLKEFKRAGLIKSYPRLFGVQSKSCDPLVNAYTHKTKISYVRPNTKADAIAVGYPTFGFEGLLAIKSTLGQAVSVSDAEMEHARSLLEDAGGVSAELSGAAGLAGFMKYNKKTPDLFGGRRIVIIITGNNED